MSTERPNQHERGPVTVTFQPYEVDLLMEVIDHALRGSNPTGRTALGVIRGHIINAGVAARMRPEQK